MTNAVSIPKAKLPVIAMAAVASVIFWSLKPIFISIIGDRGDYAEVYVASGGIAVLGSILGSAVLWKHTRRLFTSGTHLAKALGWSAISGIFLATWYYGYYRALYGASMADATVIAFTWPLIATIAIRVFTPQTASNLKLPQWLLILASFAGAVAIGVSNYGAEEVGASSSPEIVWAFVAAVGSGLYLPFAFKATAEIERVIESKPIATFYVISFANTVSFISVLLLLKASHHKLRFYAFDAQVLLVCALIGLGTYLVAEITWTWAFQEYKSLTLSSLPYFSPAVSVVLLHLLFDEPVRPIAMIGLVLILFSNLSLHANQKTTNALGLTLVATVYVALASQILPIYSDGAIPELAAALTGLFAILAGFILSRASARRTEEIDARTILVRRFISMDRSVNKNLADRLLCQLLEYEFSETEVDQKASFRKIHTVIANAEGAMPDAKDSALDALSTWVSIHNDRLSIGETVALWITGMGSIVFVLLLRDASPFGTAGSIIFAAGAFLAIFTIRDYDRNNLHGFRNQVRRLQQGFPEIGKAYYVPAEIVESGFVTAKTFESEEVRYGDSEDTLTTNPDFPKRRIFDSLYLGTASIVILIVLFLPLSGIGSSQNNIVASPRPGENTQDTGASFNNGDTVTIADTGWYGASISAELIHQILNQVGVDNVIEPFKQNEVGQQLLDSSSSPLIHPDLWLQNQSPKLQEAAADRKLLLSNTPYKASQGIFILDNEITRQRIDSLESLQSADIAQLLDTDGNGKAEVWLGASGWLSTESVTTWLNDKHWSLVEGEVYSETIFKARLDQLAAHKEPAVFYGYLPDDIQDQYDLRLLEPLEGLLDNEQVDVYVAFNPQVKKVSPEAAKVLSRMTLTAEEMSDLINSAAQGQEPAKIAAKWITEHSDRVDQWTK